MGQTLTGEQTVHVDLNSCWVEQRSRGRKIRGCGAPAAIEAGCIKGMVMDAQQYRGISRPSSAPMHSPLSRFMTADAP